MGRQKIILKIYAYKKCLAEIELENESQIDWIMNEINCKEIKEINGEEIVRPKLVKEDFIQLGQLIIKRQDIQYIEVLYK